MSGQTKLLSNELRRLAQGIPNIKDYDAMYFITLSEVPKDRRIMYDDMVNDYRPLK